MLYRNPINIKDIPEQKRHKNIKGLKPFVKEFVNSDDEAWEVSYLPLDMYANGNNLRRSLQSTIKNFRP